MENENKVVEIPYIVYEGTVERYERKEKRNSIITVILTIALVISILAHGLWIYMWNQYEYVDDYENVQIESTDGGDAFYQRGDNNQIKD